VLINLGLSEAVSWAALEKKTANPSSEDQSYTRTLRVLDYYRSILTNYQLLRNAKTESQIPPHLVDIVSSLKSSDNMPELEPLNVRRYLELGISPTILGAYAVQSMCDNILGIINSKTKLAIEVLGAELQRVIDHDRMFSQYSRQDIIQKTDTSQFAEGQSVVIDTNETWDDDGDDDDLGKGDFDWDEAWDDNLEGDQSF
jgi:hypothetical protein